jgi:hypothetical protein
MLNFIRNLFKKDEDPNLTTMKKYFKGTYKGFDDLEQAVLMLRLSGESQTKVCVALELSIRKLNSVEESIIRKLTK